MPRGKQKPHDEFKDFSLHVLIWLKENWKSAIELAGVAAVAFAIMVGANSYWQSRSQKAADDLYAAQRMNQGSDEQVEKLEELIDDYSRTPAGQEGMMTLGNIFFDRKQYDKAIEQFQRLSARSRNHAILRIAALHRMADAQLAGNDAAAAAETYLKAASDPQNVLGSTSRFRAAASFERAGDAVRAAALYRQVLGDTKDKPEDRAVREASEERLIWLTANNRIQG